MLPPAQQENGEEQLIRLARTVIAPALLVLQAQQIAFHAVLQTSLAVPPAWRTVPSVNMVTPQIGLARCVTVQILYRTPSTALQPA